MKPLKIMEIQYVQAKIAYYEGRPFLTDIEFDALEDFLKSKNSKVVDQVGFKRKDFDLPHPSKMLSLSKIQSEAREDKSDFREGLFYKWLEKRTKQVGEQPLLASPKLDGSAINIVYKGGNLYSVLTRGDGHSGKDITEKFRSLVPANIYFPFMEIEDHDIIEIRAEVVIEKDLFQKKYAEQFANPRNYVAGVIGMDDNNEEKMSELSVIPLACLTNSSHATDATLTYITKEFFPLPFDFTRIFKKEQYSTIMQQYESERETFPYQLDGVVISFPSLYRLQLGENDHHPEWAVAIKFVPQEAITTVEGIEWNISKKGEIIPTVLLKPVFLDGSTVKRASGYNADFIKKKGIGIGATVSLSKAGDIIPEIQNVIVPGEISDSIFPQVCPECHSLAYLESPHYYCSDENCHGKVAKQLSGALKILDIKRIGERTIKPFSRDFKNIYLLIKWVLSEGESMDIEKYGIKPGSRSHEIFLDAFRNIKSLSYHKVIQMLGYENVGEKISTQLAREHSGLDYDYAHLERELVKKLRSEEESSFIKSVVSGLEDLGIKVDRPERERENNIFVCLTGSPKDSGWSTKGEFLSHLPGVKEVSLSDKKCQYLITDSYSSSSNKMKTAEKKGIIIKTYSDFFKEIGG